MMPLVEFPEVDPIQSEITEPEVLRAARQRLRELTANVTLADLSSIDENLRIIAYHLRNASREPWKPPVQNSPLKFIRCKTCGKGPMDAPLYRNRPDANDWSCPDHLPPVPGFRIGDPH